MVANPANTNCLILSHFAPKLPKKNFSCLTRLDHNRAKAQIAAKLGIDSTLVKNVAIWGNHSTTQYPDVNHGTANGQPIRAAVNDDAYLNGDFISRVQKRGAEIISKRKLSSAMSAAFAAVCHIRDWLAGTPEGEFVSMGVVSNGEYGIEAGLVYSYPVTTVAGEWTVVQGLTIDEFS